MNRTIIMISILSMARDLSVVAGLCFICSCSGSDGQGEHWQVLTPLDSMDKDRIFTESAEACDTVFFNGSEVTEPAGIRDQNALTGDCEDHLITGNPIRLNLYTGKALNGRMEELVRKKVLNAYICFSRTRIHPEHDRKDTLSFRTRILAACSSDSLIRSTTFITDGHFVKEIPDEQ